MRSFVYAYREARDAFVWLIVNLRVPGYERKHAGIHRTRGALRFRPRLTALSVLCDATPQTFSFFVARNYRFHFVSSILLLFSIKANALIGLSHARRTGRRVAGALVHARPLPLRVEWRLSRRWAFACQRTAARGLVGHVCVRLRT